uniref:Basement membrane-specific heparan sulfate proteoglycan core protein n=1 Tax=Oryzias sinensis TaxID=183150 RepID=A0A8C8DYG7_9TELE
QGLFPAVLNLATMADIKANATCGLNGPEMSCKLVEHVPGQPVRNPQCTICDQESTNEYERHPIEYAIDGTNRWWQSPSIMNGMVNHYVTITLDLKQVFQVAYMIIKAANSPRPGNWILERSIDGTTFEPWQYYAITDTECLTRFNISPRRGPPSYTRDDEVICTSFYSKIQPLENGEIHASLINGRPSAEDPSPTLLNFTSARYIRLVFQRIRTLNADLMTLTLRDPRDVDPIVTRRYYYSIKDISVGGMCICYGHAKACPLNAATKFSCECEHNTCGESCDRCCPGYHQQPWMAGTFLTRHVCEKCNCHGKADECYFNQTVADLSLSLDVQGQYRGGGVCIGCRNNTAGINCQSCVPGYYRPAEISADEENPCELCSCDPRGSVSQSCVADSSQATPSMCAVGYKGFPSCERCNCSMEGSINTDPCITPCVCKENVEGGNCDRCKLGFYNLQHDNPRGCEKCFCMGVSSQCSASAWTYQNSSLLGWHLVGDSGGRIWSVHRQTPPYLSVRHSDVVNELGSAYYWNAPGLYLGNKVGTRVCSSILYPFQGGGMKIIDKHFGQPVYPSSPSTSHILLLPENFLVSETGRPINRRDFLMVLANMTSVMVRASYSTETTAVYRLHSFSMQVASPSGRSERTASAVEMCSCPSGYAGTSCETCVPGFRRVNGNLYHGVCEPCRCHGHATQCHEITGHCLDCSHNTAGQYCDTCLPGYYGNATLGSPADCQPCACPLLLPSNNFSPTCHLDEGGKLVCNRCQMGYTGPRCERCSNGFYGQPDVPGGSCQPCNCNYNLDLSVPGSCDPITGQCLKCRQGYGGAACESCADGYYGDAILAKNCQPCQCHINGSLSEVCNKESGQCPCKEDVLGRQCDKCKPETHGITTGGVCVPCHCNSFGSKSFDCDDLGQCRCQPGVSGSKCDRCSRGFFNFQEGGCTACQCSHVGNNCDANTGQCICPPNTIGERCDRCAPNHWGHDITTGCKECGCNAVGSLSQQCNMNTGCCSCRESFRGEKCDECQIGYRDFPQCIRCECSFAGSDSQSCDMERRVCACADQTGKCSCKVNVEGSNCDRCKPDTFGLSARNPLGCSKCYCYGLTHSCTEAQGLIRMWLTLKPEQKELPLVDKFNTVKTRSGVSFQHPEIIARAEQAAETLSEPFYWLLPEQFTGSMITAYGGQLKYAVYYEARDETGPSSYEPQVIVKGGPNHNMLMFRHITGIHIGQLTRHEIDMTEHEWEFADGRPMTREDFMDILFHVDYILIKASHGNLMRHSRVSEISLTVAEEGPRSEDGEKAHQIEKCDCPAGYSGLSCEECAAGFYRLRTGSAGSSSAARVPTAAGMGSCVQCQCSGHSSTCDPETSICQNCQDNTEGDRCERCMPGFYGVVRGSSDDCKPCACPLPNPENSFSPTCIAEGLDDYRCTACPEGYEGKYCERCATGYHGNPRMPGGRCEECKCSSWGALAGPCDSVTGQCRCRVGASGTSCDQCMDRHVSCDDECSGLLISDMDRLYRIITDVTLTTPLPPPYKVLYRFENMTDELKHMLSPQKAPERLLQLADSNLGSLVVEMDQLHSRVQTLFSNCMLVCFVFLRAKPKLNVLKNLFCSFSLADELLQKVKRLFGDPHQATEDLKAEKLSDHDEKLQEAQDLLNEAQLKTRQAGLVANQNLANLTSLERKRAAVSEIKEDVQKVFGESEHLLEEANGLSNSINEELQDLEEMGRELGPLHDQLDDKVRPLTGGLSDGSLANSVHEAEQHAKELNESAAILDNILAEAKNLSFNATAAFHAYTNIKDKIDAAEKEAKEAKQKASDALELAMGADVPVKEAAKSALQKSQVLLNKAKQLEHDLRENADSMEGLKGRVKAAKDKSKDLLKAVNGTIATLNAIPNDTSAKLAATKAVAADANATAIDVLERLGELNLRLGGLQLNYSQLDDTVSAANQMIQDPEKNIHAAGAKVKELEDEADRLLEKLQPIKMMQDNLRRNISQIKELINQARKQANSIKVSVSSGGDCLRSYRPDIRKGRYNTIILHVKTTTPDNLLFYLGSAKYVDFLALEMRKGKVNFLWDVGSGVGRLEYPSHTIHDGNWHRIEASRNGLNGTISVYPLEGPMAGMMPTPASANSPAAFTILDVDQNAYLFVGGIFNTAKKAEAVKTSTFTGCMGETFLDGKPIGLWNYRERQGDCKGCVVSPQRTDSEGTVQLDGEGYASVGRPTRWNPNVSTITFKFRTFSSDALLMYMATEDMKDFMSLELSAGKVTVNFDLGSGVGKAVSAKRQNDGRWKSLTVSRNKKQAIVTIVDIDSGIAEDKIVATSQGSATGLNLRENQKIYFGGLPTIGNYRPEVTLKRYAGCLRDIEVSRTPYNLLSSSDYTGITKGCNVENLHTVSFSKPGYMELGGLSLAVDTEISLSFSTLQDTGTILLAVGGSTSRQRRRQSGEPYLSVMLNSGSLEVLMFTRSHSPHRITRRPDQGILNDGREHSLRIERLPGRSFAVQVDEEAKLEAALPNDQPISLQRLFLGGIPAEVEQTSNRANVPFQGCIWNLMVNAVYVLMITFLVHFLRPNLRLSYNCPHGRIGAACGRKLVIELAYQFGLTKNSHMSFSFDDAKVRERLILEFDLRTKEQSGLVLYMARINHADFVCLGYDLGRGNISGCVPFSINDGSWHKIRVSRNKQRGVLTVDGLYSKQMTSPNKADLLDVVGTLYVGGLPQNYITRRIGPILYSLNGCIRNLKMVGSPDFKLNMAAPSSSHMVGRCFRETETGSYFDGTGYLKAVASYRVGLDVSIALEFRTTRTNGVLLTVSNQDKDGLGLEIVQGKLLFHVDNGAGRITAEHAPDGASFCDGLWHAVTATKLRHKLELEVDGRKSRAESPNARSSTCDTNDPIYVGGYPVHPAALSTKRSFKGCLKNLKITKASKTMDVQFNKALEIKGVQPLSCPKGA